MAALEINEPISSVKFDVHRWYTVVEITFVDGHVEKPVIGQAFAGEGPGLYSSYEEWEEAAEG